MNLQRYFQDKVVVITGSSRGIGRETARLALTFGARVVLNGRTASSLDATMRRLGAPERLLAVAADLSSPEEAGRLISTTMQTWGRIDVLINNAGLSMRGAFGQLTVSTVRTIFEANLLSAIWTTQAALPALRQSQGRILFVSSLAGIRGFPGVSLYSAAKMGLTSLHQSLRAEEGAQGVRSCLVYLPFTENDADKTVLASDGQPFHHERRWAISQDRAALAILTAVGRGRGEVTLTVKGRLLGFFNRVFPRLTGWFIGASKGRIHSTGR